MRRGGASENGLPRVTAERADAVAIFGSDETFARPSRAAVVQRPRKANVMVRREKPVTAKRRTLSAEKPRVIVNGRSGRYGTHR